MNASEAAVLLAKISANDNREVTEAAARAWAEALPDVAVKDAIEYLPSYYREAMSDGKNWIYPGDVLMGVRELLNGRRSAAAQIEEDRVRKSIPLPESDEILDQGGIDYIVVRARVQALKAWDAENGPMPGDDVIARRRKRNESPDVAAMRALSGHRQAAS